MGGAVAAQVEGCDVGHDSNVILGDVGVMGDEDLGLIGFILFCFVFYKIWKHMSHIKLI